MINDMLSRNVFSLIYSFSSFSPPSQFQNGFNIKGQLRESIISCDVIPFVMPSNHRNVFKRKWIGGKMDTHLGSTESLMYPKIHLLPFF